MFNGMNGRELKKHLEYLYELLETDAYNFDVIMAEINEIEDYLMEQENV